MKKLISNLILLTLMNSTTGYATELYNWMSPQEWASLDSARSTAEIFVNYPQLRGHNCGVKLAMNGPLEYPNNLETLTSKINVRLNNSEPGEILKPISIQGLVASYQFEFEGQRYGTNVLVETKDGTTFGEVFESLAPTTFGNHPISVMITAIDCDHIEQSRQ